MEGNSTSMYMPVAPAYAGGYGGTDGLFGGNGAWFILILLAMFGWGNGEFSGNSYADGYSRGYSDARSFNNGGSGMMYPPMYHGYGYGERNW